jgi:hypothetical protein
MELKDLRISDSPDPGKELDEFSFYIENGKYFTEEIRGKKRVKIDLSNFVMKSVFHLLNGTNNSQRIIYLQRYTGEPSDCHLVQVYSSELKPEAFETICISKRCTFYGSRYHLKKIISKIMDEEQEAIILELIGWNSQHKLYVFADAIFNGSLIRINELGITEADGHKYYLPAFGFANLNDEDYKTDRLFCFREGKTDFKTFARLFYEAYGDNGAIGLMFVILACYRDVVFDQVGFFPFLFLFGDAGTGKTSFTETLLSLFGRDVVGTPLNNATTVGLSRLVSSRTNSLFYLKEYTNETDVSAEDFILTAYDGAGRTTGIKSNDTRTKSFPVKSAMIFDGNHLPTQKSAILSRMILLNFESATFTGEETKAYNDLKALSVEGFGAVLIEILRLRPIVEKNFRNTFLMVARKIKTAESMVQLPERTINHLALIYSAMEIFSGKLSFPFNPDVLKKIIVDNAVNQNNLLKESSVIHVFWESFSFNVKKGNLIEYSDSFQDNKKTHFRLKTDAANTFILQIKLPSIYPYYVRYCKDNNTRFLDQSSLRMILTAKTNTYFIHSHQKGRNHGYTDKYFGFCYQFSINKTENGYEINEVEINL